MSGAVKVFTDQNFSEEVLSSDLPVVVDFWATWCVPCKMLGPIVEDLANEYEGSVVLGKMDVDTNPGTASKYNVMNLPTILFFKNGEIVDQHVGLLVKKALKEKIDGAFSRA